MTKAEWDAMEQEKRNGLVLTTLWKAENGKPIDIRWSEEDGQIFYGEYIPSGKPWKTHEISAIYVPRFTTDRNACALVLDEADLPVLLLHLLAVTGETDVDISGRAGTKAMCNLLRADPDTICYCAVKAVEDV